MSKTPRRHADAYEAAYMGVGEDVVHREKIACPKWFQVLIPLLILAACGAGAIGSVVASEWIAAAAMGVVTPVALLGWLTMSTLRVTVTSRNLHVQYGLWGPSIPLESIEHCKAEHYSVWKYGGYGIRYSISEKAWCYNMLGDQGQAVRVHWRDENGKLRRTLVASENHVALAAAINQARATVGAELKATSEEVIYTEEHEAGGGEDLSLEEELAAVEEALAEVVEEA